MNDLPIAKEGFRFITFGIITTVLLFVIFPQSILGFLFGIITLWVIWFFRNPARTPEGDENDIIAPADGRIIVIEPQTERYFSKETKTKVSIFMNIFSVHVNRSPLQGTVTDVIYNKGKFLPANKEKASLDNEQVAFKLQTNQGSKELVVIQIAGLVARRIINYLKKGDQLERGQRFGLIRFGSRVDLYLPADTEIKVEVGMKTVAGQTIIGRLSK